MPSIDWYVDRLRSYGTATAIIGGGQELSYCELVEICSARRRLFIKSGITLGSKVAIVGDFSAHTTATVVALASIGAVTIPFSHSSTVEMERALNVSGCDFVLSNVDSSGIQVQSKKIVVEHRYFGQLRKDESPGLVLFTSGTTGTPKGIVHDFARMLERFRKGGRSYRAVPLLMFDHFGGFNTMYGLMSSRSTIVMISDRSVDSVCRAVEEHRIELLPATPSFLALLIAAGAPTKYDLSSLKKITYGTEMMPTSLLNRVVEAFPNCKLQQTYGLSEVGVLSSKSEQDNSTWIRVGGPGFETKIVDGVLWIRSEYSMLGYLGEGDVHSNLDGWFNTKDRVEVRGEYIRFLGRDSDLINVAGQKVMPTEVEDCLLQLPYISEVRVSSKPHNLLGQVVHADLVLRSEAESIDKRAIRQHCKEHLAAYKVPQSISVVSAIGLTSRLKKQRN